MELSVRDLIDVPENDGDITGFMPVTKRKVLLLSVYYSGEEPLNQTKEDWCYEDWNGSNREKFETKLTVLLKKHYPNADVFDLAIEDTRPWLMSKIGSRITKLAYWLIRKKM